ncbi:MAG TPA: hypothetical protein VIJ00_06410 [Nakamurella sp.]
MGRAAALGGYRVGAPLPFEDLRFARSDSALAVAVAVAWLARGSPESPAAARAAIGEVEAFCADTGYPQTRFDAGALAAVELLRRVGHGDIAEMGALLARAVPPVAPAVLLPPGPAAAWSGADLSGGDVPLAGRWPAGGAVGGRRAHVLALARTPSARVRASGAGSRCTVMGLGVADRPGTAAARAGRRRTARGAVRHRTLRAVDLGRSAGSSGCGLA